MLDEFHCNCLLQHTSKQTFFHLELGNPLSYTRHSSSCQCTIRTHNMKKFASQNAIVSTWFLEVGMTENESV